MGQRLGCKHKKNKKEKLDAKISFGFLLSLGAGKAGGVEGGDGENVGLSKSRCPRGRCFWPGLGML